MLFPHGVNATAAAVGGEDDKEKRSTIEWMESSHGPVVRPGESVPTHHCEGIVVAVPRQGEEEEKKVPSTSTSPSPEEQEVVTSRSDILPPREADEQEQHLLLLTGSTNESNLYDKAANSVCQPALENLVEESVADPRNTGLTPPFWSSFFSSISSTQRLSNTSLHAPSLQLPKLSTETRSIPPATMFSSSAFCDPLPPRLDVSPHTYNVMDPNPMSLSQANGSTFMQDAHAAGVTELLEDFFFGGKITPAPESDCGCPPVNDNGNCNVLKGGNSNGVKVGYLAPASPTTVITACFDGKSNNCEHDPLLLDNRTMESYGAIPSAEPPKQPPPHPPPPSSSPQQVERRTIFKRSSLPYYPYPSDFNFSRRPFSQRSSSLSELPSETLTKISNSQNHNNAGATTTASSSSSTTKLPSKPALKRCSSVGQVLPQQKPQRMMPQKQRSSSQSKVSFGVLEFREYEIALSDHPGCSYGPPIQLGWDYGDETTVVSLDDYEKHRTPRRSGHQLVLSGHDRRHSLQTAGYSKADLLKAVQEVERIKRQRLVTKTADKFCFQSRFDEAMEHCLRWVQGFLFCQEQQRRHENA